MKFKIFTLLFLLSAFVSVACQESQPKIDTHSELDQLSAKIETLTAEAEGLNEQADALISTLPTPDVDWTWIEVQGGDWKPSQLDLVSMKMQIQLHVEQEANAQGVVAREWDGFFFQYQGIIRDGQKLIALQGLCHPFNEEYLEIEFIVVSDGGPCIFGMRFDPETNQFSRVNFNGEA